MDISVTKPLHDTQHGVPKCVTPHPNGKLYYVDIRAGEVVEYNPATKAQRIFACEGHDPATNIGEHKDREYATAIGLNQDGSLIVARQSGIYMLNPAATSGEEWQRLCGIPGVGADVRPNNGTMIECHDGKTRFFLGTATISGNALADGSKPGKLFVLESKDGTFELKELARDFITVNAVSGFRIGAEETKITFADSHKSDAVLKTASFFPHAGALREQQDFLDFKAGQAEATQGRPDGTSPVTYYKRRAVAVAAIDTNEIRIFDLNSKDLIGKIMLPETVKKPTMATFTQDSMGRTVAYISTLSPPGSADQAAGKIYTVTMPQGFEPVEHQGTYPGLNEVKAAAERVSREFSGRTAQA